MCTSNWTQLLKLSWAAVCFFRVYLLQWGETLHSIYLSRDFKDVGLVALNSLHWPVPHHEVVWGELSRLSVLKYSVYFRLLYKKVWEDKEARQNSKEAVWMEFILTIAGHLFVHELTPAAENCPQPSHSSSCGDYRENTNTGTKYEQICISSDCSPSLQLL